MSGLTLPVDSGRNNISYAPTAAKHKIKRILFDAIKQDSLYYITYNSLTKEKLSTFVAYLPILLFV